MARMLTSAEAYDLAMHLIGVHRNAAAGHSTPEDNADCHWHEHFGPGGIRDHEYARRWYDPEQVEETLEEAERCP
jgi:hypothetical protein